MQEQFLKTHHYRARSLHLNILECLASNKLSSPASKLEPGLLPLLVISIPKYDYDELIRYPRINQTETSVSIDSEPARDFATPSPPPLSLQATPRYTPAIVDLTPPKRALVFVADEELALLQQYTSNNCIYQKPAKPKTTGTPAVLRPIRLMPALSYNNLDRFDYGPVNAELLNLPPTRKHWLPNKSTPNCMQCYQQFTTIPLITGGLLRHHCRVCGGLYCSDCIKCQLRVTVDQFARFVFGAGGVHTPKVCGRCVNLYEQLAIDLSAKNLTGQMYVNNPFAGSIGRGGDVLLSVEADQKRLSTVQDEGIVWSSF